MQSVNVGHAVQCTIMYLDKSGNPMLVTPVLDSPPVWINAPNPAGADTTATAANGTEFDITTVAPGSDTVDVKVIVGGVEFDAELSLTITAAPQELGSVQIVTNVV